MDTHFIDGDDTCSGCSRCCHDETLRLTDEEFSRLPLFSSLPRRSNGPFVFVALQGACPYLGPDGRCTTFATRPFDCSLYPAWVIAANPSAAGDEIKVAWGYLETGKCKNWLGIMKKASRADEKLISAWIKKAYNASSITISQPLRERLRYPLYRLGILNVVTNFFRSFRTALQKISNRFSRRDSK